jgi:hypothetical protein
MTVAGTCLFCFFIPLSIEIPFIWDIPPLFPRTFPQREMIQHRELTSIPRPSVSGAVGRCHVDPYSSDCLSGAIIAVFTVWYNDFSIHNEHVPGKQPIYAIHNTADPDSSSTQTASHIPVHEKQSLMDAAAESDVGKDGAWVHIATTFKDTEELHYIFYRLADSAVLGHPNPGNYHHFQSRASPALFAESQSHTKGNDQRSKSSSNGVVADYVWRDGDASVISGSSVNFGAAATNWMEENGAEATCATVGVGVPVAEGGVYKYTHQRENQGIVAYGWNNVPFDFAGRAGNWVDSCY